MISVIHKLFNIKFNHKEKMPHVVCAECLLVLTSLVKFAARVCKIQEMYKEILQSEEDTAIDIKLLFEKYEVDQDVSQLISKLSTIKNLPYAPSSANASPCNSAPIISTKASTFSDVIVYEPHTDVLDSTHNTNNNCKDPLDEICECESSGSSKSFSTFEDVVAAVICEPDIVIKTEDDDCEVKATKCENGAVEASSTPPPTTTASTFMDFDDTSSSSSSSDDFDAVDNNYFDDEKYKSKTKTSEKGSISPNKSVKKADGTEYVVTCKICTMGFQRMSNYKTHMKKKHKIELDEGTKRKKNKRLSTAERRMLEPKITCNICSMGFQRSSNYTSHMRKIHKIVGDATPFSCPNCPRKYEFEYELKRHMKKYIPLDERLIFPCPQCDRKFQTKVHVTRHIQFVHDNSRPFICEECGEAVHTRTILREHMLTHTDYSPFECKVCGKSFKRKQRLKRHMEIHGEKHICTVCGKELSSRCTLNKHLLVHTEDKAHKCEYCGRAFKLIKTLKVHLNIHTGEKRYECNFCDKVFSAPSTRRQHKKKKHPEKLLELEMLKTGKHIKSDAGSEDNSLTDNANENASTEAMDFSSSMNQPTTSSATYFKNPATMRDYPLPDFRMLDFVGRMMLE